MARTSIDRNRTRRSTRRKKNSQTQLGSLLERVGMRKTKGRGTSARRRSTSLKDSPFPPVMVRGEFLESPFQGVRRKGKKARRRYDVALSLPGAEIRLPALPQVRIGWRLVSAFLVVLLGFALQHLWNSPMYRVNEVDIAGLERITEQEIMLAVDVFDRSIFELDQHTMQQTLETGFPEFLSVDVKVALPNNISVDVVERVPALVWNRGGEVSMVDEQGFSFPTRRQVAGDAELPTVLASANPPSPVHVSQEEKEAAIVAGKPLEEEEIRPLLRDDMVKAVQELAAAIPPGTTLVYDSRHGLGWGAAEGWHVFIGDVTNIDVKLNVYQAIVQRLQADAVQPRLISVEYADAPYFRLAD